ncbi:cysteine-tRNA ligase [Pneumocystis jirovecii RU7]|uniref:cysteine--tRNA ligase n=1 Tax=Pneumocystis jirovecii (strain RU7) TaxID=1408657 RepID=A0A0W4ZVG5_PNEJ7|nr:cysteine-tRNA ligase [Pneumocystis jirovecii RU7]KTW32352.1 cysteine-tRNA ligase [Pneumocystis jirovecii RU7]
MSFFPKEQRHWSPPKPKKSLKKLVVWNSLTREKNEFVPLNGRKITWYCCGPTVYDWSHMGHARNYVTTDIIRRILQDYFKYDVIFVQNVTDIDDKIIIRARHNYFYNKYAKTVTEITPEVYNKVLIAWKNFAITNFPSAPTSLEIFEEWSNSIKDLETFKSDGKLQMNFTILTNSYEALISYKTLSPAIFLEKVKDILVLELDKELKHTINDNTIFREIPAYWERKYNEDMKALDVLEPSVIVRVTEFIPKIIEFIKGIMKNGYAYEFKGSILFDTSAFEANSCHTYAKIEPWNKNNKKLIIEGEGSLTQSEGKKVPSDFALWKASKPGEPAWDSPWGRGRPGWHIECSAMAAEILGSEIDIHSGGIDLAFPHHDNEIAQSEGFFDSDQWVNYFFHIGHLHIEGQKMSKSLKNFITIQDALKKYTSKQMRLYFLMHQWNLQMDFKESFMSDIKRIETLLSNFFANINALVMEKKMFLKQNEIITYFFSDLEKELYENLYNAQDALHSALCDNFNTPVALDVVLNLITKTNKYISQAQMDINILMITNISKWVSNILGIFGLKDNNFNVIDYDKFNDSTINDHKEIVMPYIKTLSSFRDKIRNISIVSRSKSNIELSKDILQLCDKLRDSDLTDLGIQLEDRDQGDALIKFVSKEELQQEKKLKQELLNKKASLEQEKLLEKILKGKLSPKELFQNNEYSKWDNQGLPTHDAQGNELTKSKRKRIAKDWEKQHILHEKYLEWCKKNTQN